MTPLSGNNNTVAQSPSPFTSVAGTFSFRDMEAIGSSGLCDSSVLLVSGKLAGLPRVTLGSTWRHTKNQREHRLKPGWAFPYLLLTLVALEFDD